MSSDFVRIISTPKYGDVAIVDDVGDIGPDDCGHVYVYIGTETSTTVFGVPRFAYEVVSPFTKAALDPLEIQATINLLDKHCANGQSSKLAETRKHVPFAKIFRSERYGQIVAIKNGDMEQKKPHIMVQFRPTRPTNFKAVTLIRPSGPEGQPEEVNRMLPTPRDFEAAMHYFVGVRFEALDLEQIEKCVEGWIQNFPKDKTPPITFT